MKLEATFAWSICVTALIGALAPPAGAADALTGDHLATQILEATGARTKIVWAARAGGTGERWGSGSAEWQLMGFDTDDGKERVILPGPARRSSITR